MTSSPNWAETPKALRIETHMAIWLGILGRGMAPEPPKSTSDGMRWLGQVCR